MRAFFSFFAPVLKWWQCADWDFVVTFGSAQVDLVFLQLEELPAESGGIHHSKC